MVAEHLGDHAELPAVHAVNHVIPTHQIQPHDILVHFLIENIGQFHSQVVRVLQFGIELDNTLYV